MCLFTYTGNTEEIFDLKNDQRYQDLATDFRTYTVCEAVHEQLGVMVSINYGISKNLGYPNEYLMRMKDLLNNINNMQKHFAEQSQLVTQKLIKEYNFPEEGLNRQAFQNKNNSRQGLGIALRQGSSDPDVVGRVVKTLLAQSQSCRDHVSKIDYSNIE